MTAVQLTNRERDQLINTIDKIKEQAILLATTPYDSIAECLAIKCGRLHYDRMLDILYPGTATLCPVVPIEELAPPPLDKDASNSNDLPRAEGYGPPTDVKLFVLDSPVVIIEILDFLNEVFGR